MDVLKDVLNAKRVDAKQRTLCTSLVQNLAVTSSLYDGYSVLLLVFADAAADFHAFGKQVNEVVVYFVNFLTQLFESVGVSSCVAEDES